MELVSIDGYGATFSFYPEELAWMANAVRILISHDALRDETVTPSGDVDATNSRVRATVAAFEAAAFAAYAADCIPRKDKGDLTVDKVRRFRPWTDAAGEDAAYARNELAKAAQMLDGRDAASLLDQANKLRKQRRETAGQRQGEATPAPGGYPEDVAQLVERIASLSDGKRAAFLALLECCLPAAPAPAPGPGPAEA